MLGEPYYPSGQALETAQAVLNVENPMALNMAWGCTNNCIYCYGRNKFENEGIRFPKEPPLKHLMKHVNKKGLPEGLFLSFMTDPLIPENIEATTSIFKFLRPYVFEHKARPHIDSTRIALLTKASYPKKIFDDEVIQIMEEGTCYSNQPLKNIRLGATIVSTQDDFHREFEPNALPPFERIDNLREMHYIGYFTWVSFEPDAPPAQYEHNPIEDVLQHIDFVDLIVYGKMNYLKGCGTQDAKDYYVEQVPLIRNFCKEHDIQFHLKKKTREFIGE